MRYVARMALGAAWMLLSLPSVAQSPNDVPQNHWARPAVTEMVRLGVLQAPNGKFAGARVATRAELAQSLANLAKALDAGKRVQVASPTPAQGGKPANWATRKVTRYELAATLWRVSTIAAAGIPRNEGKRYGKSDALPAVAKVKLKAADPGYQAVKYLASKRMCLTGSPLLTKSGSEAVTGREVVGATSEMVVGLTDQFTDEPEIRVQIEGAEAHEHKH